jgi:hypothetical protein
LKFDIYLIIVVALGLFSLVQSGCKGSNKVQEFGHSALEKAKLRAYPMFFEELQFLSNTDSSFILCLQKEEPIHGRNRIHFILYDAKSDTVVFQDKVANATVKWISKSEFKVSVIPGIIQKGKENEVFGYIFNVVQKTKELQNLENP